MSSTQPHYIPVRMDDMLVRRLRFITEYEGSDRSKIVRDLLRKAADQRFREIATGETASSKQEVQP